MLHIAIHVSEDLYDVPPEHEDPRFLIIDLDEEDELIADEKVAATQMSLRDDCERNHYLYLQPVTQPVPEFAPGLFPGLDGLVDWLLSICEQP